MYNIEIREALKKYRVYGYELASKLGMSEFNFSRLLSRQEFTAEKKKKF